MVMSGSPLDILAIASSSVHLETPKPSPSRLQRTANPSPPATPKKRSPPDALVGSADVSMPAAKIICSFSERAVAAAISTFPSPICMSSVSNSDSTPTSKIAESVVVDWSSENSCDDSGFESEELAGRTASSGSSPIVTSHESSSTGSGCDSGTLTPANDDCMGPLPSPLFPTVAVPSSSSSRRNLDGSVVVDSRDASVGTPPPPLQCLWSSCRQPLLDDGEEMMDHLLKNHVQPAASRGDFRCCWTGCRVFLKPARNFSWLQSHVIGKHCGSRPYRCPVPNCRFRFSSPKFAERHVNNHLDKELQMGRLWSASRGGEESHDSAASCSSSSCSSSNGASHEGDASTSSSSSGVVRASPSESVSSSSSSSSFLMQKKELKFRNFSNDAFDEYAMQNVQRCLVTSRMNNSKFCLNCSGNSRKNLTTFHCKILARRISPTQNGATEILCSWIPQGFLPTVWMPSSSFRAFVTVPNSRLIIGTAQEPSSASCSPSSSSQSSLQPPPPQPPQPWSHE